MTCATEHDFIARVERLIGELASRRGADRHLLCRWQDALTEGYGRALALEGRRRRLRLRQLALADLPEPDAAAQRELVSLSQREVKLARQVLELRAQLEALKEAGAGLAEGPPYETMPRRSA
ncbi:MAG: hypothetical protein JWO21_2005 [Solirubrobacterales bacterium]|jgi:hypothetical protein|nr:hypothetical protein [Solirubrobacterales bacterium]